MARKTMPILFLTLCLISCHSGGGKKINTPIDCSQIAQQDGTTSTGCTLTDKEITTRTTATGITGSAKTKTKKNTISTTSIISTAASTWDANIYFENFNSTQEAKIGRAIELMKKVVASQKFKDHIINHTYNGQKTFVDNAGFTNTQIYQKILNGAEKVGISTINNAMDVELELYYALTTTIGYTYPNVTRIWMNTKYFNHYTPVQVTGNLMHEWMHKLGFAHATTWSKGRDYSVPYAIGYLMEEMAKQYQ